MYIYILEKCIFGWNALFGRGGVSWKGRRCILLGVVLKMVEFVERENGSFLLFWGAEQNVRDNCNKSLVIRVK